MRMQSGFWRSFACGFAVAAMLAAGAAAAQERVIDTGRATFVSGGVGEDSFARMEAARPNYNLRLLFAMAKTGNYLAGVAVTVAGADGAKVIEAVSDGPVLLANLRPGDYTVTADYDGKIMTQKTRIAPTGQREIVFRFEGVE